MKLKMSLVLVPVLLLSASVAMAIPYQSVNELTQEANPSGEGSSNWNLNWDYVYNYKGSSSVAIASHWILTAAHVADDAASGVFTIGSTTYTPQETRYYDGTATGSTSSTDATNDLALVRLDNALPGYYNYATSTNPYHGDDVLLVGYGNGGTVVQTTDSGYWTETGSTTDQRWGTNNIDGSTSSDWSSAYGAELPNIGTYSMYRTSISGTLSSSKTDYETGLNIWDSGGPMFVKSGEEWIVAGINVLRGGDPLNTTYSMRVGDYDTWITDTVPEPATMSLLALGGVALLHRRRKQ